MRTEAQVTGRARSWISPGAYERLQRELTTLRQSSGVGAGHTCTEDTPVAEPWGRQERIRQIHGLLANAYLSDDPPDDGIAEPGMVLTIRYDDTGDVETFLLGVRGAESLDMDVYSNQSPLGAAIEGARPGERRSYELPDGTPLVVTLLDAAPYGVHTAGAR